MEKQLVMPKLQPEMKSGVLCAWLKDEGDEIHKGDALYEIETDKVVNQLEASTMEFMDLLNEPANKK